MSLPQYLKLLILGESFEGVTHFVASLSHESLIEMNDRMCLGEMKLADAPMLKLFGNRGVKSADLMTELFVEGFEGVVILAEYDHEAFVAEQVDLLRQFDPVPQFVIGIPAYGNSGIIQRSILKHHVDEAHVVAYDDQNVDTMKQLVLQLFHRILGKD